MGYLNDEGISEYRYFHDFPFVVRLSFPFVVSLSNHALRQRFRANGRRNYCGNRYALSLVEGHSL
jgi:hypothetical protein